MAIDRMHVTAHCNVAAGTDPTVAGVLVDPSGGSWVLVDDEFCPGETVAANATNYVTFALAYNDGAAGSFTNLGTNFSTASTANTLGTNRSFSASGATTYTHGATFRITCTESGTGAIKHFQWRAVFEKVPA